MIRVTKEFTFDMAHALLNYDGPCKNIHGHTYKLQVTVSGYANQDPQNAKCGMLIDFGKLKKIVEEKILEKFDHSLVLNEDLPASLRASCYAITEKVHFVSYQPTCENLLLEMKFKLQTALELDGFVLQTVKLFETPTSWAEWCREDQPKSFQ
ncbi:MAG: 6-carboxytetrahydropterin synthase [Flavobacterium sp.]|nr:MAG: 6-carboxytetrahydropterin synthase [Flavobacterium sp.]